MDEEYIELAKKFFKKNEELISRVVETVAENNLKKKLKIAQNAQAEYLVTYSGKSHNGTTKLNKLAYQAVSLLVDNGATAAEINDIFSSIFPKKDFLLLSNPGQNKGKKISIQGTDYWVPTNIWAAQSNYVKNLLGIFYDLPDLSYETFD